jgi:predicted 3-demethylubiquinone-9 3-methyltransferase (glyoxalase superfamily)
MQKITTFLWFNDQAEEAAKLYVSIFKKGSKITGRQKTPDGKVMGVNFKLQGQEFMALNGGPHFKFTPAISLYVDCKTQKEVDTLWKKLLSDGGKESRCGWLEDRFGLSWQIIPAVLPKVLGGKNKKKAAAAMQAMMGMVKLDAKKLQEAYDNG